MDSNNTTKRTTDLDIRDIVSYLLSKLWIIALVVLCFAIIAYLWTSIFVVDQYTSTTKLFIVNTPSKEDNTNPSMQDWSTGWSIGKQLTKTSSELITGNYCERVAKYLNEHDSKDPSQILTKALNDTDDKEKVLPKGTNFKDAYGGDITGSEIRSCIKVNADNETCIVTVTATHTNKVIAAAISNAVLELFGEYINEFMQVNTIVTEISSSGKVPSSPSNANATRNAIIFGAIGAVLVCAVLVVIFIFDDKIKTPDDIEKQLNLSVLGAIPEIEEA